MSVGKITDGRTVGVPVSDQDRAIDFYVGALGFEKRLDVNTASYFDRSKRKMNRQLPGITRHGPAEWPQVYCAGPAGSLTVLAFDIRPRPTAGIPATTPVGAAGEVRGSRAGLPRRLPACPAAMFLAAFTSALPAKPQAVHGNRAWLSRDTGSTCPHAEHRWLVKCGLTRPLNTSRRIRCSTITSAAATEGAQDRRGRRRGQGKAASCALRCHPGPPGHWLRLPTEGNAAPGLFRKRYRSAL